MAKNNKKGPKSNVFKVAGAKSLKKTKAKAVNLGLKNAHIQTTTLQSSGAPRKYRRRLGQPIKYKRKPGSRRYIDYTPKQLEECLAAVRTRKLTQRDASEYYNIPRSTIKNKLAKKNCSKPGRQPIFSEDEEQLFATRIATLSEFGFPVSNYDTKMIIKDYLTSQNKTVTIFKSNVPGKDWLKYFFDRHTDLCEYLENKLEKSRHQHTEESISDFIDHITVETEHVPPQNIYSYYEISLRDDPSKKTVVCRRGVKYPETTSVEAAKARFSVMFCGNAVGEAVPPYIVYKSEPGCSTWTQNGPKGAHYNCTRCGWMNSITFENWFLLHLLPDLKKRRGRKVLIGDNLTSHINGRVLNLCEKYNIRFVCVPYKSNHLLQPLHYAYFQPLRLMWPQLLLDWHSSQIAKQLPTMLKEDFPFLLKKALNAITDITQNIVVGFEKSGIFPIDKDEPLYRLPISHQRLIDNHMLKPTDYELLYPQVMPPYSQDYTEHYEIIPKVEIESASESEELQEDVGTLNVVDGEVYIIIVQDNEVLKIPLQNIEQSQDKGENQDIEQNQDIDCDQDIDQDQNIDHDQNVDLDQDIDHDQDVDLDQDIDHDQDINQSQDDDESQDIDQNQDSDEYEDIDQNLDSDHIQDNPLNIAVDDHVIVTYGSSNYPGKVLKTSEKGAYVHCMKRWKSLWRWPSVMKEQLFSWEEIVCKINAPKLVKRGCFFIPEIDCN